MASGILKVKGDQVVDSNGKSVVLRGAGIGGWMKYGDATDLLFIPWEAITDTANLVWRISSRAIQPTSTSIELQCSKS